MIPLSVYQSVRQVVLLGDQSQLQPTVLSQQGRDTGLQKSLFERYLSSAVKLPVHYSVVSKPRSEKTGFCIGENKDADQLRGNRVADQRLCFHYLDSTIPILPRS